MNPFAKHDVSDFPDTHIPLANAERNPVVAAYDDATTLNEEIPKGDSPEDGGSFSPEYSAFTLEGLRAEIDSGRLAGLKST